MTGRYCNDSMDGYGCACCDRWTKDFEVLDAEYQEAIGHAVDNGNQCRELVKALDAIKESLDHTRYIPCDTEAASALHGAIESALTQISALRGKGGGKL